MFVLCSTEIGVLCKLFYSFHSLYAWLMPQWLNDELISEQLFRSLTVVLSLWGTDAKHTLVEASQLWGFYISTSEMELCSHPCHFVCCLVRHHPPYTKLDGVCVLVQTWHPTLGVDLDKGTFLLISRWIKHGSRRKKLTGIWVSTKRGLLGLGRGVQFTEGHSS